MPTGRKIQTHRTTAIFITTTITLAVMAFGVGVAEAKKRVPRDICLVIEREAKKHKLPVKFFTRLLWKESHFHFRAVSDKGAKGIAQFMPETARLWGLRDPFNPYKALPASAKLLAFLRKDLGNLGLAAAAYNAGRLRVQYWRDKGGVLPEETEDYVFTITGWPASYWRKKKLALLDVTDQNDAKVKTDCRKRPILLFPSHERRTIGEWQPWGVHLAASHSRTKVLKIFARLKTKYGHIFGKQKPMILSAFNYSLGRRPIFAIRMGVKGRAQGIAYCIRYRRAGGSCVVKKS